MGAAKWEGRDGDLGGDWWEGSWRCYLKGRHGRFKRLGREGYDDVMARDGLEGMTRDV